jgi:predicted small secreted protein
MKRRLTALWLVVVLLVSLLLPGCGKTNPPAGSDAATEATLTGTSATTGGSTESIRRIARQEGMKSLLDNLKELVLDGTTTLSELRRTYSEYD